MNEQHIGATWKKWDLHVHTPASIVHNYPGTNEQAWDSFLDDLERLPAEFKVIGINDYIFVDGYERVLKEKRKGRLSNIDMILPVVELRLDKFAGTVKKSEDGTYSKSDWNRINLHVIFDQLEPEIIRQQFLSSLVQCYHLIPDAEDLNGKWQAVITPESIMRLGEMVIEAAPEDQRVHYASPLQEGFNNLCVSLDSVLKALDRHDLKGRHLLAVGKAEWENMKWTDQSIAEKRNVINRVDLVFSASANPLAYTKARKKLVESNVTDKLLDCSDAHDLSTSENKDRIGQCFTWIKADATFQGLVHAVGEFEQRVFVGDMPPKPLLVSANRTKYIQSIKIVRKNDSTLSEEWFDTDIPLNHDLVSIIGNKGSGKSALADVISLLGDSHNHTSFSFLNEGRFRDPRSKLAAQFIGTLRWQDGTETSKGLHENPNPSSVERVKYLPQSYLETLCNELAGGGSSTFDGELRKIIYTHVPEDQQIGFNSLDELLSFKISELEEEQKLLLTNLSKINYEIVALEERSTPSFKTTLELQLDERQRELRSLEAAKPLVVENPEESEQVKQEAAVKTKNLTDLEEQLNLISTEEQRARAIKTEASKGIAQMTRIYQALKNHQKSHNVFLEELQEMLREAQSVLKAEELASLVIVTAPIENQGHEFRSAVNAQEKILTSQESEGLLSRRSKIESDILALKSQLGEKQRLYLVFREQLSAWEKAKSEIYGDRSKPNSIVWYEEQIRALQELPSQKDTLRSERTNLSKHIHAQIIKIVAEYRNLYEPVQNFVQSTADMGLALPLDFDVRVAEEGFQELFLNRINRQAKGSFSGVEESHLLIRNILKETDFSDVNSTTDFIDKIDDLLHYDRRNENDSTTEVSVTDQLRKEYKDRSAELYDYIFGLSYLRPQYSLTYDNQEISQLSPGERGLLLLVFYLMVDKDNIPLIIDQPEENLDNQTIFKVLVHCIKSAKQQRQVIIVTHNPNLAVVCDAEQIIAATCDKAGKKFNYISGAVESPQIKKRVIEILEGTEPAFVNRKRKYGF